MDNSELETACQAIRPDKESETIQHLQAIYRKKFDSRLLTQSRKDIAGLLDEMVEPASIREILRQSVEQQGKPPHKKERSQER